MKVGYARTSTVDQIAGVVHRPTDIARRVGVGRTSVYRILGVAE